MWKTFETAFAPDEISEIWITFPDEPQESREKKRLTSPRFLNYYKKTLQKNGILHLKTDSFPLYQYTLETIQLNHHNLLDNTADLYGDGISRDEAIRN